MRSVFVFPNGEMAATIAILDRLLPGEAGHWSDGKLFIDLEQEQTGPLFTDWEPEAVRRLDEALGQHPTWALQIGVSGRIDGSTEVRDLLSHLLRAGGVAVDDYSDHCWTLQEVQHELKVDGLGFFDFLGHYARSREQ